MKFIELVDHLDAEVFTGDMLYDDVKRGSLLHYSKRWIAEIERHLAYHPEVFQEPKLTSEELRMKYNNDQYPKFPKSSWFYEVEQGNTICGYWDWVAAQIEEATNAPLDNTEGPALYVKVQGGVVQAIAVRNLDLGDKQLEVIVDDLDSAEEDGRPDLIAFNGGEVPKEFVFIW